MEIYSLPAYLLFSQMQIKLSSSFFLSPFLNSKINKDKNPQNEMFASLVRIQVLLIYISTNRIYAYFHFSVALPAFIILKEI